MDRRYVLELLRQRVADPYKRGALLRQYDIADSSKLVGLSDKQLLGYLEFRDTMQQPASGRCFDLLADLAVDEPQVVCACRLS